jgi:succinyldiaminopimelate transaminase
MTGFVPPPYPYDRLSGLLEAANRLDGGAVDLSIGTPCDPPPAFVVEAMATSDTERGYPASVGSVALREAVSAWMHRRLGIEIAPSAVGACIGTKELVASTPQYLRLRSPERDTVLHPAIAYPTYAMGATLAGCRAVAYEHLDDVDPADADRALCLWVNSPANPHGVLIDLGEAAEWGRRRQVPVLSDECYIEFTWADRGRTILEHGSEGVLAVHSLSKRSNLAGARVGAYAGDAELVHFLGEVRKHAGFMVPGPVQAAAVAAWGDDAHVDAQREVYRHRLERLREVLAAAGAPAPMPDGGFYLWAPAPDSSASEGAAGSEPAWALAARLAEVGGAIVTPGETFGPAGTGFVRVAAVQPDDRIELVATRFGLVPGAHGGGAPG